MQSAIIYLLDGEPNTGELKSRMTGEFPAIDVEGTDYLDGKTIYHGEAAGRVSREQRVPALTEEAIFEETVETVDKVKTDWFADLEEGWAGISTGDGEFLFDWLVATEGIVAEDAKIRLDAWAERLERQDDANVWGVSYSQSEETGHDSDRSGAKYHDDVATHNMPVEGKSSIGFSYSWGSGYIRGTIAASGYVAAYNVSSADVFAKWVTEEVLPYVERDIDGDQQFLEEIQERRANKQEGDETPTEDGKAGEELECENCPRESERAQKTIVDGDVVVLCPACRDAYLERGELPA